MDNHSTNDEIVYEWLYKKLKRRKYNSRPLVLYYLRIGKAVGRSYSQVRWSIIRLEKEKKIQSWTAWTLEKKKYKMVKYYRLPECQKVSKGVNKAVDKSVDKF